MQLGMQRRGCFGFQQGVRRYNSLLPGSAQKYAAGVSGVGGRPLQRIITIPTQPRSLQQQRQQRSVVDSTSSSSDASSPLGVLVHPDPVPALLGAGTEQSNGAVLYTSAALEKPLASVLNPRRPAATSGNGAPLVPPPPTNGSSSSSSNSSRLNIPSVPTSFLPSGNEPSSSASTTVHAFSLPIQSWGGEEGDESADTHGADAAAAAASSPAAQATAQSAAAAAAVITAAAAGPGSTPTASAPEPQQPQPPHTPAEAHLEPSDSPTPKPRGGGSLQTRVIFGALLGAGGAAAVAVKQLFLLVAVFITYHATQEYYSMVTSKGITKGMAPPPAIVSSLTTVLCVSMVLFSYFYRGRSGMVLAVAAFFLLVMNMVAIRKPKFSMLASTLFGVFYCGWLPSFWVKLRFLTLPAPELQLVLPGLGVVFPGATWTVGLVATFMSALCVVAADTGAYFVGKTLGRTKLTEISPKKTVEGAIGGLASSIAAALVMWKLTQWPPTPWAAAGLGVITFFSSLFGDLIESIIKRDAGMKDSGDLIPGHGGLLDRFDSYMFTGAVTYFYVLFVLPYIGA